MRPGCVFTSGWLHYFGKNMFSQQFSWITQLTVSKRIWMFVSFLTEETEQGSERTSVTSTSSFIKTSITDVNYSRCVDLPSSNVSGSVWLICFILVACCWLFVLLVVHYSLLPNTGRVSSHQISKDHSQISVNFCSSAGWGTRVCF